MPPSLAPLQEPSKGQQDQDAATIRQRKRRLGSEGERPRPAKRPRTNLQSVSNGSFPLTKHNLQKYNRLAMGSESDSARGRRRSKRPASRARTESVQSASMPTEQTASVRSQKTLDMSANYRHTVLSKAGIHVQHMPTPEEICTQIDAIIHHEVTPERKETLSCIAQQLSDRFVQVITQASGEDDCIEPFYHALSSMDHNKSLAFQRKADWRLCLKPRIQPPYWSFNFIDEAQYEAADSVGRPSKRQQGDTPYLSPHSSGSAAVGVIKLKDQSPGFERMPPPPPPQSDLSPIKTPRPDISIGLRNAVLINALQSQGLTKLEANNLLEDLQETKARNRSEPALCSKPTQRALDIRFPFLPVEGKAYATGNPVFDAQNQAAVSGACALNILHDLDDLARRADSGSPSKDQLMVFSVCTEGPYHELWAHYTTLEDGIRMYNMVILKTCNAVLYGELLGFLVTMDNVMSWGAGEFLENIAKQLGKVAKAAKKRSVLGRRVPGEA
ncbi:hypothetical protein MMC31_002724 [Peltigera leucophlebia]|nr:hypothetical protein [Peltigera leucophlebia]